MTGNSWDQNDNAWHHHQEEAHPTPENIPPPTDPSAVQETTPNPVHSDTEPTKPYIKVFDCKNCGASVTIRGFGQSVTAVCQACGAVIDVTDENYQIISKFEQKKSAMQVIPLGQRGELNGTRWEVIGFMTRRDILNDYSWSEYLLFNPRYGYRWLIEDDGHWNFATMIKEIPVIQRETTAMGFGALREEALYDNEKFYLFNQGNVEVTYVVGEFYWRIQAGQQVLVADFICPPRMLSCEKTKEETVWSVSEYLDAKTVQDAFKLNEDDVFPMKFGVAPNQPSPYAAGFSKMMWLWAGFVTVLIGIQFVTGMLVRNEQAYQGSFSYQLGEHNPSITSPAFDLSNGWSNNIAIHVNSPVDNSWLFLDSALVNENTGKSYGFDQTVEYYHGYSGGEYWAEGGQSSRLILSRIPPGRYHLDIEPSAQLYRPTFSYGYGYNTSYPDMAYTITIVRSVLTWKTFIWFLIFISILPKLYWYLNRRFERERWSSSSFSPYASDEKE